MQDVFGYHCESEHQAGQPGEPLVARDTDINWNFETLPTGAGPETPEKYQLMEMMGPLPRPKPDWFYGYSATPFQNEDDGLMALVKKLPLSATARDRRPWFPYLVIENKAAAGRGQISDADLQADRDGAAAVSLMHNFYELCGVEPTSEKTAVFSIAQDERSATMRVHWRSTTAKGEYCYEADWVTSVTMQHEMSVYEFRSAILNILNWARTNRLSSIKSALRIGRGAIMERAAAAGLSRGSPKKSASSRPASVSASTKSTGSSAGLVIFTPKVHLTRSRSHSPTKKAVKGQRQDDQP